MITTANAMRRKIFSVLLSMILASVLLFCVFGFIATYEPLDRSVQLMWRFIYGVAGAASIGGLVLVWLPSGGKRQ